jgi:hypothetical protein
MISGLPFFDEKFEIPNNDIELAAPDSHEKGALLPRQFFHSRGEMGQT